MTYDFSKAIKAIEKEIKKNTQRQNYLVDGLSNLVQGRLPAGQLRSVRASVGKEIEELEVEIENLRRQLGEVIRLRWLANS